MNLDTIPMEHEHATVHSALLGEEVSICRWNVPFITAGGMEDTLVVVVLACPQEPTFKLAIGDAQRRFEQKVIEILDAGGVFACSISSQS